MIYLWIFNRVDGLIGSVLGAKLDRRSSGSGLVEQNCVLPWVSRRRRERAGTAFGRTTPLHVRACPRATGVERWWTLEAL